MNIAEKLTTIAENEKKVYDAGKQAQYDLFWDKIQQNGTRTNYSYAFANWVECENIFYPKYDIKPVGSIANMFSGFMSYVSLPAVCAKQGIVMDFSKVTSFSYFMYNYCAIWRLGVIDCSSTKSLSNAFMMASSLITIDKLILHEGITSYTDCFTYVGNLKNITIEGTIAGNGFNVSGCTKLTHESLMSIINALKDYSGTTTTKTITLGSTNLAKLTDVEKAIATEKGWTLA